MPKRYKFIINAVLYVLLGLILTGAVGSSILREPFLLAPIRSNSMYPLLERGDAVFVFPVNGDSVAPGDIVIFHPRGGKLAGQNWVMHRVIAGDASRGFVTRGDANEYTDQQQGASPVKPGSIAAGAVTVAGHPLKVPLLGYPSLWLEEYHDSPYALPAFMIVVALALIGTEIKDRRKGKRRGKSKSRSAPAYAVYFTAGLALCVVLAAAQITSSSFITLQYEVSDAGRGALMGSSVGILQKGDVLEQEITKVSSRSFLPMVASMSTADPRLTFNRDLLVTRPGHKEKISVTVHARQAGEYSSRIYAGMFLPTLPPFLIHRLAQASYWLALGAVCLVPGLPLLLWPVLDRRMRRQMARRVRKRWYRLQGKLPL